MRRTITLAVLALALAACGGTTGARDDDRAARPTGSPAATASDLVEIKMFTFAPQEIRVRAGTAVTWTNRDQILHTVTAGSGPDDVRDDFDGQLADAGATFSFTFDAPGTYDYFCTRHPGVPGMHGVVVVT